jgi:hypothetical protein
MVASTTCAVEIAVYSSGEDGQRTVEVPFPDVPTGPDVAAEEDLLAAAWFYAKRLFRLQPVRPLAVAGVIMLPGSPRRFRILPRGFELVLAGC